MNWQDRVVRKGQKMLEDGETPEQVVAYFDRILAQIVSGVPLSKIERAAKGS
jgi:hypothetical protein